MPVVDIHTHVFPEDLAARAVGSLVERGGLRPRYDGTIGGLLADMDRTGVSVSVLQPVATRPGQVVGINDWTASLISPRIVGFGGMHPDFPDPHLEIARMAALGLKGIKFHPDFQQFRPDEERMRPIYDAAAEHGLVILFHAGEDPNYSEWSGTPAAFRRVLAEHPGLTVILAHMGGYRMWEQVADHLLGENCYLDTAYTFGHLEPREYGELIRAHGADRILFGSDGPWTDAARGIEALAELGLTDDDREAILWRNAARLLDLGHLG